MTCTSVTFCHVFVILCHSYVFLKTCDSVEKLRLTGSTGESKTEKHLGKETHATEEVENWSRAESEVTGSVTRLQPPWQGCAAKVQKHQRVRAQHSQRCDNHSCLYCDCDRECACV